MLQSVAVTDRDCVDFLRWALPQIGLRWEGFRKVRRQVCRRFDLILCRNVAFTYFDTERQRAVLTRLRSAVRPGGALVLGLHEQLPEASGFAPWPGARAVFRR
jgi:chemotaxis methyl-accepting protein methylase